MMVSSLKTGCQPTLTLFLDLAEYTEAKERIALGKKARKDQVNKRKATIAELIDEAYVVGLFNETRLTSLLQRGRR